MTPEEFVNGLMAGGSTNISDFAEDPDYCPVHAWDHSYIGNLYHENECKPYARKLAHLNNPGRCD